MHSSTPHLKRALVYQNDLFAKIQTLRGAYENEIGYVVACGPSLLGYEMGRLRRFLQNKLVFALKQSFNLLPSQTDFHILVPANAQRYDYGEASPIVIDEYSPLDPVSFSQPDLMFPKEPAWLWNSISLIQCYDAYEMQTTPIRPCGPGTLYEIVFYLALHLGLRNLVVLGWDNCSDPRQMEQYAGGTLGCTHFYEPDQDEYARLDTASNPQAGYHQLFRRYEQGQVINTLARLPAADPLITALGSAPYYRWLRRKGLRLFTTTDSPNVSRRIPRVDLFETGSATHLNEAVQQADALPPEAVVFNHFSDLFCTHVFIVADSECFASGWYHPERSSADWAWRWSGPDAESSVFLMLDRSVPLLLSMRHWTLAPDAQVQLLVDGQNVPSNCRQLQGMMNLTARIPPSTSGDLQFTRLTFACNRAERPRVFDPTNLDPRFLAFALVDIKIEPE